MQKWEYLIESSAHDKGSDKAKRVKGQELEDWRLVNLYEYVNQLGEEGWELVSMHLLRGRYRMVFKRPKE